MVSLFAATVAGAAEPARQQAAELIGTSGVAGGLVVHVGCGDGKLTAALRANDSYLVHGLDADAVNVEKARDHIRSLGLYGSVSVEQWAADRLPYTDNLVNLLVAEDLGEVPMTEVMRVLAPRGKAMINRRGTWTKTVKPWPAEIDEWTHYLHDASNNAVAHDSVVGPPRHLRWVGSPRWTRHHDHISSFNAMVAAGGRVFYVIDEGPRAEVQLPPQWALVARDGFSGVALWKRRIHPWHIQLWPLKSGPAQLPRRLVAVGDTVYVTLGLGAPLAALEAATGKPIRTYAGTEGTEEVLYSDGVLFLLINKQPTARPWSTKSTYTSYGELQSEPNTWAWGGMQRRLAAVQAGTGKLLWQAISPVAPMTLTADANRVYFHDGTRVVALNRDNGQRLWASAPIARAPQIRCWFAPTLVVQDDVLVFAGGEKIVRHRGGRDTMTALSAKTGEVLWSADHPPSGYDSPEDVFIIDGIVWTAPTTNKKDTGTFTGRDLHTGEVKRTFRADDGIHMPHHRCHRAKATDRYILASRTGIEYVDLKAEHWNRNDWVRGACLYGVVPANGLTYAPPHSCACYIVAKLNGLNALAPRRPTRASPAASQRLVRGPAYDEIPNLRSETGKLSDWLTYRHDPARSGFTDTRVPTDLKRAWRTDLGGRLTSPVIAQGKVFVASVDTHTVHALDEDTGKRQWSYTAGGRVDSPPTVWHGRVLFGSADGHVYCLRADDGVLVWRFRAAPDDLRVTAWEQVESAWPVHGSVLLLERAGAVKKWDWLPADVQKGRGRTVCQGRLSQFSHSLAGEAKSTGNAPSGGVVHCVAGRSMFLDGGLRFLRLDAASGKKISETILDSRHPKTGKPLDADIKWPNLPVALPDVLSYDGKYIYMRSQRFDVEGKRVDVVAPTRFTDQKGDGAHLFCPTGFLDDSWWHRTYWLYGKSPMSAAGGWYLAAYQAPAGRIMVCDGSRVYAFGRRPQYFPRTTVLEYHLFAAKKQPKIVPLNPAKPSAGAKGNAAKRRRRPGPTRPAYDWSCVAPVLGRALVLAGDTLFVAGPPDVVDQQHTITHLSDPATAARLAEQRDAYAGKKGGVLLAVSVTDGKKRAAYRLQSIPVFDGMAGANACLFVSTTSGSVVCFAGQGQPLSPATDLDLKETPPVQVVEWLKLTTSHPDFQHLEQVQITPCDLGTRLKTAPGNVGLALRRLPSPLTKRTTFKLRLVMIPSFQKDTSKPPPGNGFLVFGDGRNDAQLVKCGIRSAGQRCMIVEGPLLTGSQVNQPVKAKVNAVLELVATIDPDAQKVTMTILGQQVEAILKRRLDRISYIGYAVHSVTSEFSPIEVIRH